VKAPTRDQLIYATQCLLIALQTRDLETGDHAQRVSQIALTLGRALNFTSEELDDLKFGAMLHDVGKIRTPDAILKKPAKLTAEEWTIMREHPNTGGDMLRALNFPAGIREIVEQHHEKFDGTGYPYGRIGDFIRPGARAFAIADCYDAVTRNRVYRTGRGHDVAIKELIDFAGTQFDPEMVKTFLTLPAPELMSRAA